MKNTINKSAASLLMADVDYSEYIDLIDWACCRYGSDQWRDALGIEEDIEADETISIYIQEHGELIDFDGGILVSNF